MTPQQLTALNLDKTGLLSNILQKHFGDKPSDLLGELQFSFLAFLMGQSLEGEPLSVCQCIRNASTTLCGVKLKRSQVTYQAAYQCIICCERC